MKYVFLAIGLLVASCTTTLVDSSHSFLQHIPNYNVARANKEWSKIEELNQSWAKYQQVVGLMEQNGFSFDKKARDTINLQLDIFLFHKAAATIYLFYGDYESMTTSITEANKGLDGVEKLIIDSIEGNKV